MNNNDIKVYSLEEVSKILNVTTRTLYDYLKSGKLKGFKIGNKWRITQEELKQFIEELHN